MSDTAEYSAVATNQHGTATSKATVTVKSKSFSYSDSVLFMQHSLVMLVSCNHDFLLPTGPAGAGESCHLGLGEKREGGVAKDVAED